MTNKWIEIRDLLSAILDELKYYNYESSLVKKLENEIEKINDLVYESANSEC